MAAATRSWRASSLARPLLQHASVETEQPRLARRAIASPTSRDIDLVAARLRSESRCFTARNLYHALRRARGGEASFAEFRRGPLAERLRSGAVPGLLPPVAARKRTRARSPREWEAYFPAAILLVDRPELVDLFAASGVLVQARLAVVCLDGSPAAVIDWLRRGLRAGRRAPIGYLHDAATVVYPFLYEPLKTCVDVARGELPFVDLGLPPRGMPLAALPFARASRGARFHELEEAPPHSLIAYAARRVLALVPPDPMLAPLARGGGE